MFDAFGAGATSYLVKASSSADLIQKAISAALAGARVISADMLNKLVRARLSPEQLELETAKRRGLGQREVEVAKLMVSGLDDKTIADELKLSPDSIRSIKRGLYAKLPASSRVQVVLRWIFGETTARTRILLRIEP